MGFVAVLVWLEDPKEKGGAGAPPIAGGAAGVGAAGVGAAAPKVKDPFDAGGGLGAVTDAKGLLFVPVPPPKLVAVVDVVGGALKEKVLDAVVIGDAAEVTVEDG